MVCFREYQRFVFCEEEAVSLRGSFVIFRVEGERAWEDTCEVSSAQGYLK
jgi:hypothetical protein